MKVLFIVDNPNWAFDNIARNIKSHFENNGAVEISFIYTCEFDNYNGFLKVLEEESKAVSLIHFFWRDYLMESLEYSINNKHSSLNVFVNKHITTHIPDHLYLDNHVEFERRYILLNFIDGYFVTSEKIEKEYKSNAFIQKPLMVIHDIPHVEINNPTSNKSGIDIVWIGNSKWGEHLNYNDYKGLNKVVKPAVNNVICKYDNINYVEFDRAKGYTDRRVIMKSLADADILLISSVAEGTPLPLIEAMANKCAIVTTDVGIAHEVLPESQRNFIVERTPKAFESALSALIENPDLLENIKNNNAKKFEEEFGDNSHIYDLWLDFFNQVLQKDNKVQKKKYCGELNVESRSKKYLKIALSRSLELSKKAGITDILRNNKKCNQIYYKLLSKVINKDLDYSFFAQKYHQAIKGKKVVALYSGYWLGVANSTRSFFGDMAIPYPLFSSEYPQITEHVYLDELTELLSSSEELESIILSGGSLLQEKLAERVKKKNTNIKIYFLWHGSPAQWCDSGQYSTFYSWNQLYKKRVIDGFITCKPGLEQTLQNLGIFSFSMKNFIPEFKVENIETLPTKDIYKVGFFAALFSWYKNPFPQLVSLSGIAGMKLMTNIDLDVEYEIISERLDVTIIPAHMSNIMFVDILSKLHVVLYVTNTECSPMIALEAISVGTPCIVGPAGNIYKGNKRLEELLVVNEVDNADAISRQLEIVRDNYQEIKELISHFKIGYNSDVERLKCELLKDLSNV